MLQENLFSRLLEALPDLQLWVDNQVEGKKLKSDGYMDLGVDILGPYKDGFRVALSHYYRHESGDMIPDPDMELYVDTAREMCTALTFQNSFIYQSINDLELTDDQVRLMGSMNEFLEMWLVNIIASDYSVE